MFLFCRQELNLYTDNFSAMATQAAVLAGFTTTCLIEIDIPEGVSEDLTDYLSLTTKGSRYLFTKYILTLFLPYL